MGNKESSGRHCQCLSRNRHRPHPQELQLNSHHTQTTSWLPPRENWDPGSGLPYGWEVAIDKAEKTYFINHVDKYTTREDPRDDPDYVEPPKPRDVELIRDPNKGFGFVAGSEKPVIVRFVTEGGPSVGKLLPADQLIKINGEDIKKAPREYVIDLVRSCKYSIKLTICQPYIDNSSRKSAILTTAKKARLKSNPSRVRFADSVIVNGASVHGPSAQESYVPLMPNVLKVFLENGQTKSFKYDNKTTVKDVLDSLQEKLNIKRIEHFALVLQNTKSSSHGKLSILQEHETLAEIAARPGAMHFRCLFRVTFVPRDAYDLLREDTIAFEYFYMQCCNDVLLERFAAELKYDTALRLAALQIQQHAMSNNVANKISIKTIERDCGLDKFVPPSLLDSMKGKDIRKMIQQYLKMNQSLSAPGQKQLTALQAKLHYLKIISELKTFGSRIFMVTLLDKKSEGMVLVGPKSGVSLITNIKSYAMALLTDFDEIDSINITKDGESMHRLDITQTDQEMEHISLGLLNEDVNNFLALVEGYYRIFVNDGKSLLLSVPFKNNNTDSDTPLYEARHKVVASMWSYPADIVSQVVMPTSGEDGEGSVCEDERIVDLSSDPPPYQEDGAYIKARVNKEEKSPATDVKTDEKSAALEQADESKPEKSPTSAESNINLQNVILRHKCPSFDEGVTSFGRESSSSDAEIESLIQIRVNNKNKNGGSQTSPADAAQESDSTISSTSQANSEDGETLRSFSRYVPSPIASQVKRFKAAKSETKPPELSMGNQLSSEMVDINTSRFNVEDLTITKQEDPDPENSMSDADTDSVFGPETERKPLLSIQDDPDDDVEGVVLYQSNQLIQSESDDTDSWSGTPENSPSKQLPMQTTPSSSTPTSHASLSLGELGQSFGLHSPDQLPSTEMDYEQMTTSFGLHSPDQIPAEMYNAVYDPRLFCDGGLYLDPDIIEKVRALTADSSFPMQHIAQGDLPAELWLLFYMVNCYISEEDITKGRVSSPCDLTLLPPPKTPDDDLVIDFSNLSSLPPPGFTDNRSPDHPSPSTSSAASFGGKPSMEHVSYIDQRFEALQILDDDEQRGTSQKLGKILMVPEEESDSGNETISSENIELTNGGQDVLLHLLSPEQRLSNQIPEGVPVPPGGSGQDSPNDIEALIAKLTVPPPPSDDTSDVKRKIKSSKSKISKAKVKIEQENGLQGNVHGNMPKFCEDLIDLSLEEEIASLIIPPPPISAALIDIPIVPPVNLDNMAKSNGSGRHRKLYPHRRANSVDLSLLRRNADETTAVHLDSKGKGPKGKRKAPDPPNNLTNGRVSLSAENLGRSSSIDSVFKMEAESPSTVSERLNTLLKSIPIDMLENSDFDISPFAKTYSYRERSASVEDRPSSNGKISRSSSLRVRRSACPNMSIDRVQSTSSVSGSTSSSLTKDISHSSSESSPQFVPKSILKTRSVETILQSTDKSEDKSEPSGKSDTFAALKAKLQEYRDIMLRRKHGAAKNSQDSSISESKPGNPGAKAATDQRDEMTIRKGALHRSSSLTESHSRSSPKLATGGRSLSSPRRSPPDQQSSSLTMSSPKLGKNVKSIKATEKTDVANGSVDQKKVPMKPLFNTLPINFNKLSLRSLSATGSLQDLEGSCTGGLNELPSVTEPLLQKQQVKKRGPLKALRAAFENQSSDKSPDTDTSLPQDSTYRRYSDGLLEQDEITTSSDVEDVQPEKVIPGSQDGVSTRTVMKRSGDLMMWRPISRKSSNGSSGNSVSGSGNSSGSSISSSSSSHRRSLSAGNIPKGLTLPASWDDAPDLDGPTRSPSLRSTAISSRLCAYGSSGTQYNGSGDVRSNGSGDVKSNESGNVRSYGSGKVKSNGFGNVRSYGSGDVRSNGSGYGASNGASKMKGNLSADIKSKGHSDVKFNPTVSTGTNSISGGHGASNGPTSYAFITQKHTNFIKYILTKTYDTEKDFLQSQKDVDCLVIELKHTVDSLKGSRIDKQPSQLKMCKDELLVVTRQFVMDAKFLVSSATQSLAKLLGYLNSSIHTLARIFMHSHATMLMMSQVAKALQLGQEVTLVADAYKKTVVAAQEAVGKPLSDPTMKQLMRQATGLANLLGELMTILKSVDLGQ